MDSVKVFSFRVTCLLFVVVATSSLFLLLPYASQTVTATNFPTCNVHQLAISVAATYPLGSNTNRMAIPITVTNEDTTCLLPRNPSIQAVLGLRQRSVTLTDVSGGSFPPLPLLKGQSAFVPINWIPPSRLNGQRCKPVTTDGLILGEGLAGDSNLYIHHVIHGVCSNHKVGNLFTSVFFRSTR
jgi:hypothetical protein